MAMSGTIGAFVVFSGEFPLTVVFFRCLIGAAALLGWLWHTGLWSKPDRRAAVWIAVGAAAILATGCACLPRSRCAAFRSRPWCITCSRLSRCCLQLAPFLVLAFIGVVLTTGISLQAMHTGVLNGVLLAVAAAFLYALATLATRQLKEYPPAQIAGLQLVIGVVVLAPITSFEAGKFSYQTWSCLPVLVLGLVHTGLVYNLMYGAFQRLRAETIASLSFIYPAMALAADLVLFDARLGALQWMGMALILASVVANDRIGQAPRTDEAPAVNLKRRPGPSGCHGNCLKTGATTRHSCD